MYKAPEQAAASVLRDRREAGRLDCRESGGQVGQQRLKRHLRLVGQGKGLGHFAFSLFKSGSHYCVEDESERPQGAVRRASRCIRHHFSAGW